MANLNKILVHVPSNLCDGFKTKYVTATTNRNTSYDNKVVFLEKTQEIFTKGKLYGTNIGDFNDLKALVGTIPSGATSTNIIDYINEKINSADHIHSVSKKSGETLIDVTTADKAVTINSTSALTTAVSNANSAIQSVSFLGKTLNKTTNSITVEETKTALGLGSAAYKNTSDFDAAGAASTAAAGVEAKLPVVTNGSGITVTPTTDGNGKTTYTVSTSAEVFHYKGNKTALSELPSTGNTTGDVWSVGPANAVGSTLYAWDGDEWINIGGANGITGVDTTSSKGVALAKNTNGTVKVNVTPGSVASENGSVVTGGAVYTAIAAAEERSNAKVLSSIKALDKASSTVDGTNVHINYKEEDGIVTINSITEDYTNVIITRSDHSGHLEENWNYGELGHISIDGDGLINASGITELSYYVNERIDSVAYYAECVINDVRSNIEYTTYNSLETLRTNLKDATNSIINSYIPKAINSLDKPSSTVDGTNVHVKYKEEDGIVNIESVTEDYATVNRTPSTNIPHKVNYGAYIYLNEGDESKLVNGADLMKVVNYAQDKSDEALYAANAYSFYLVQNINCSGEVIDDMCYNIRFCYSQDNGMIGIYGFEVNYADLSYNSYLNNGIVTGECLNNVLENIWENYEG